MKLLESTLVITVLDTSTDDNVKMKLAMAHIASAGILLITAHETLTYPHPPVVSFMFIIGLSVQCMHAISFSKTGMYKCYSVIVYKSKEYFVMGNYIIIILLIFLNLINITKD